MTISLDSKVLSHVVDCWHCSDYNQAYFHVYPERSGESIADQIVRMMTEPIED